ncbi:RNA polymerase sigma factor [Roseivirga sp. E12]|uniref:RNA polymerase sigma factor n=1 Tax=Roseivirga sp. E12 TaxID=2819237 RepID=UPI001ABCCDA3|nr:RNA polymerase sigma factor [Roseivirga sp. E12]MBO3700159.1 RNA polymerase sigma factor [Roseivirga sp. E12]
MLSDKALIRKCKKDHPNAQKQLYEMFSGLVMHIAKRYTGTYQEAEDVFQEAFVDIYTSLKKTKSIDSLKNWIYTITLRRAISFYRSKKREAQMEEELGSQLKLSQDDFNIFDKLEYEQLMEFIQKLPDGYRIIFNLYLVEGFSHKEIATSLDISESTSRSQLTRCKKLVIEYLKQLRTTSYEKTF